MTVTNNVQDNIVDRDQLQDQLINQILDDMDIKTMMALLYDMMDESYDKYSVNELIADCLLYTSPSPRDGLLSRMPSSA